MGFFDTISSAASNAWGDFTNDAGSTADALQGRGSFAHGVGGALGIGADTATGPIGAMLGSGQLGNFIMGAFSPPDVPSPQTPGPPPDMNQIRQQQLDQQLANEKNQASSNPIQTTGAGLMGGPPLTSQVLLTGKAS